MAKILVNIKDNCVVSVNGIIIHNVLGEATPLEFTPLLEGYEESTVFYAVWNSTRDTWRLADSADSTATLDLSDTTTPSYMYFDPPRLVKLRNRRKHIEEYLDNLDPMSMYNFQGEQVTFRDLEKMKKLLNETIVSINRMERLYNGDRTFDVVRIG